MKTVIYWPTFLGPLGQKADFWAVVTLLLETMISSDLELFLDAEPSRPALKRLFDEMRIGRVGRVVVRSLSDLCLTDLEFGKFVSDVLHYRVRVEQIWDLLPSALYRERPELLGQFRHRQLAAKVIRLRGLGMTIPEISLLAHATPQQVYRILSRPR